MVIRALLAAVVFAGSVAAQPKPATQPSRPAAGATKEYCQPQGGFCFRYPTSWDILGEAYINGVILAPQQKLERTLWDEITVATIVLPPEPNHPATSIDQVIETAMVGLRDSGRNPETLQRQQRTVDGKPAQMIKVRYHDPESARDWIEQLVFVEGTEQEIYSIALKCAPDHQKQLEPVLAGILQSWKLREAPAPAETEKPGGTEPPPPKPQ